MIWCAKKEERNIVSKCEVGQASQSKDQKERLLSHNLSSDCSASQGGQDELQFAGAVEGRGGARFRRHSHCCESYCTAQTSFYMILMNRTAGSELKLAPMSVLPRLHSGQACLELSTQLISVLPCARSFPFSLSEYLWTRKMVDFYCDLQCGPFSGFSLLLKPLCFIGDFRTLIFALPLMCLGSLVVE